MNYMTVREASLKWGIKVRQVQNLCEKGKVKGAIRFNRSWAIPENLIRPEDDKRCIREVCKSETERKCETFSDDLSVLKQTIDNFPYGVNVTTTNGIMVYANDAFMEGTLEDTRKKTIGNYNLFEEKMVEKWGLKEHIEKAFRGERVCTRNLKLSYKETGDKYGKDYAFISVYHDITSFPIFDGENKLKFVVTVFIPVRKYYGRDETVKAREYIDSHWKEPFDVKEAAKAASLSPSRFIRLFREDTGFSPHDYYVDIKMNHLRESLLNFSISVSQAFNECGMDYNSYYTSLFKKNTGYTPMQFRKKYK
ncbi:MAG: helix-turn-helix transcriptional regulator [Clostridiales bacterium]|nr:helix-turn-helix transcriptional regulator [Clostridiales bacterium]